MSAWMLSWCLWMGGMAWADDPVTYQARTTVTHGEEVPEVRFQIHQDGKFVASVRCGEQSWRLTRTVEEGQAQVLLLPGIAQGEQACELSLAFEGADGSTGEAIQRLTLRSLPLIELSASAEDLDLDRGRLKVRASRAVSEARVSALGPRGHTLFEVSADLSDPTSLSFRWPVPDEEVVVLQVDAVDDHDFRARLELRPWSYAIPHEDVVFATGSAEITAEERPKLEAIWGEVERVLDRYGKVVDIKLYVAGYTDTVGDREANQALSGRRARAIATWFVSRGFPGPVFWQGFGEDGQAVPTGDGVDEPANRRAVYVLAAEPPRGPDFPRSDWRRVR